MLRTWLRTVAGEVQNAAATSLWLLPPANSRATSSSSFASESTAERGRALITIPRSSTRRSVATIAIPPICPMGRCAARTAGTCGAIP